VNIRYCAVYKLASVPHICHYSTLADASYPQAQPFMHADKVKRLGVEDHRVIDKKA